MDVTLFESAALALCTASAAGDKARAEETLNSLLGLYETASSSPVSANASVHLSFYERYLEQVTSPYAQFILFSRLKALLNSKFSLLANQELLDTRKLFPVL